MPVTINDDELDLLISDVKKNLLDVLDTEKAQRLAKAAPPDDEPGAGAPPSPSASAGPPVDDSPAPPAGGAPPPDAPPAPGADAPPGGEEAGAPTFDELKAEFAKLAPEELEMYFLAAKAAMQEAQGAPGAGAPPSPSASAGPPPSAAPSPSAPPAMKAEMKPNGELAKAEAKIAELSQHVENLAKMVEHLAVPQRKAITASTYLGKSEDKATTMTDTQIKQKLGERARERDLKKSDRELINSFCVGTVNKKDIEHLLK